MELLGGDGIEVRWPDPKRGPWAAVVHFALIDGQAECVGLQLWAGIEPAGEGAPPRSNPLRGAEPFPITTSVMREVSVTQIVNRALAQLTEAFEADVATMRRSLAGAGVDETEAERVIATARGTMPPATQRRGRPRTRTEADYRRAARVYSKALSDEKNATEAVRDAFQVSYATAAKLVSVARNTYGFLPPTSRGRARGGATRSPRKSSTKKETR